MLSTESEQLLNEIYYNVNHPAGFSNASRLYHAIKGKGIKLHVHFSWQDPIVTITQGAAQLVGAWITSGKPI